MRKRSTATIYPDQLASPIHRYNHLGNTLSSVEKLQALYKAIKSDTNDACTAKADISIDLAMRQPANVAKHMGTAAIQLENITSAMDYLLENGYVRDAARQADTVIRASLHTGELATWGAVATGDTTGTVSYERLLSAAEKSQKYMAAETVPSGHAVEFMPVLLGARALRNSVVPSWNARLSLIREDERPYIAKGQNPNWDCGIADSLDLSNFATPSVQLQMAVNKTGGKSPHPRVTDVRAKTYGLSNPVRIIQSCLAEFEPSSQPDLLSSSALDDLTGNFYEKVIASSLPNGCMRAIE